MIIPVSIVLKKHITRKITVALPPTFKKRQQMSNIIKSKNKLTALVDFDWDLHSWISFVDVLFEMVTVLCLIQKPVHFINIGVINISEVEVILVLVILYCLLSTLMKILRMLKNRKYIFKIFLDDLRYEIYRMIS